MIDVRPVGRVRNEVREFMSEGWDSVVSEIEVEGSLAEALDGIEEFSHLLVLFWLDRVGKEQRAIKKIHPKDRVDLPVVGVLATRSQYRPNPVGATVVRLLARDGCLLRVKGLDALDGTPIIDIKPHIPTRHDEGDVRVPPWIKRLEESQ